MAAAHILIGKSHDESADNAAYERSQYKEESCPYVSADNSPDTY